MKQAEFLKGIVNSLCNNIIIITVDVHLKANRKPSRSEVLILSARAMLKVLILKGGETAAAGATTKTGPCLQGERRNE